MNAYPWSYAKDAPLNILYDGNFRILATSGISTHNYYWINRIRRDDVVICGLPWHWSAGDFDRDAQITRDMGLDIDNFYVMCNEPRAVCWAAEAGFNARFINKNCFVDYNLMRPTGSPKIYNAVINARPERWKGHHLAREIADLALIVGFCFNENERIDLDDIPHVYHNDTRLSCEGVREVLSSSRVGLCLSSCEGACFSAAEYLFCGIPVVSIPSIGGRSVWFDDSNSIICASIQSEVGTAVKWFCDHPPDPHKIRQNAISQADYFRGRFISMIRDILKDRGEQASATEIFTSQYRHKMTDQYMSLAEAMQLVES